MVSPSQIQVCVYIHQSVSKKCIEYLAELARHNYVTPKSYLELLRIFSILFGQKKLELKTAKNRMKSGLDKVGLKACGHWLAMVLPAGC
jgi:dynein heavy chain